MYAIGMGRVVGSYLVAIVSCDGDIDVVVAASLMTESWTRTFRVLSDVFPHREICPSFVTASSASPLQIDDRARVL